VPPRPSFDVSVVIPLFNKADYVRDAVESVIAQSLAAREIIVVDDGSTDGSARRIADLAGERVRIVEQSNAGPGPARNRGVAEASTDWVAFLDADDTWLQDHLATLADVAKAFPQAAVVGSSFALGSAPLPETSEKEPRLVDLFVIAEPIFFCASSVAVRRSVFEQSGAFGAFWPGEDVDLWARLALDHDIAISPKTTALYRQQTGGLMDQSKERFGNKVEMQPIFGTLDAALADERYTSRHRVIAGYRDQWLAIFARQALAAGRPRVASAYLQQMQPGSLERGLAMRILARLPSPLLKIAMHLRSTLRGL
jgi:glycosyltransferase involved in cell wall biosynthesis